MYAVVRRFKSMRSIDEAARRAAEGMGKMLRGSQGFVAYYVVRFGADSGGSITLFETQQAAQDAQAKALAWIKSNLSDLTEGEPEIWSGEVLATVTGQGTSGGHATAA
jgi:hypothetical protein